MRKNLWDSINTSKSKGSSIARTQEEHAFITNQEVVILPDFCGYGPDKGNMYDLVEFTGKNKKVLIKKSDQTTPYLLKKNGVLLEENFNAVDLSTSDDLTRFRKYNVAPDFMLAVTDCTSALNQSALETERFTLDLLPGKTENLDVKKAKKVFLTSFPNTKKAVSFYHSLQARVKPNSIESILLKNSYNRFVNNVNISIETLNDFGANITEKQQSQLVNSIVPKNLSFEEMEQIGRQHLLLDDKTRGLHTIWYNKPNFEKKK